MLENGSSSRTRTYDRSVNSRLLYQLSYRGMSLPTKIIIIQYRVSCQQFFKNFLEKIFCLFIRKTVYEINKHRRRMTVLFQEIF